MLARLPLPGKPVNSAGHHHRKTRNSRFTAGVFIFYAHSTPFLAMDGADLVCVLEQRVRLDDLLRRKKRFANETGHCFFPAQRMLGE
jgi:hypothetical protein